MNAVNFVPLCIVGLLYVGVVAGLTWIGRRRQASLSQPDRVDPPASRLPPQGGSGTAPPKRRPPAFEYSDFANGVRRIRAIAVPAAVADIVRLPILWPGTTLVAVMGEDGSIIREFLVEIDA